MLYLLLKLIKIFILSLKKGKEKEAISEMTKENEIKEIEVYAKQNFNKIALNLYYNNIKHRIYIPRNVRCIYLSVIYRSSIYARVHAAKSVADRNKFKTQHSSRIVVLGHLG